MYRFISGIDITVFPHYNVFRVITLGTNGENKAEGRAGTPPVAVDFERYKNTMLSDFAYTKALDDLSDLRVYDCGKEQCVEQKHVASGVKPYYLFHYVENGRGVFVQDGRRYEVKAGEMFVAFPNRVIEYWTGKTHPWLYKWFSAKGTAADAFVERAGITADYPIADLRKRPDARRYIDELVNRYFEHGKLNLSCIASLYMIFHELIESDDRATEPEIANPYVNEALKYMRYNIDNAISVSDVANSLNLSAGYFIGLFTDVMGVPPKRYLIKSRMELAARMMEEDVGLSVADTAKRVGYRDPLHFSREYKKFYGSSPREHRRRAPR
jgi:AraC-like DNA-binding protein